MCLKFEIMQRYGYVKVMKQKRCVLVEVDVGAIVDIIKGSVGFVGMQDFAPCRLKEIKRIKRAGATIQQVEIDDKDGCAREIGVM